MHQHEFDTQIRRLQNTYNEKAYPDERRKALWKAFEKLPDGVFERVTTELIANNRQPPMLSDFGEALRAMASFVRNASEQRSIRHNECRHCGGDGFFHVEHFETKRQSVASCEKCALGAELRTREDHPIASISAAASRGYVVNRARDYSDPEWLSDRCPGMPVALKTVCILIKINAMTDELMHKWVSLLKVSKEDLLKIYDDWYEGKIHPIATKHSFDISTFVVTHASHVDLGANLSGRSGGGRH